jgi:hypothetical protein
MKALITKSVDKVQAVLEGNPGCALDVFWDCDQEPPLCFAVRIGCDSRIVQLLLEHGADIRLEDVHGQTALEVLHMTTSTNDWHMAPEWSLDSQLESTSSPWGFLTPPDMVHSSSIDPWPYFHDVFFHSGEEACAIPMELNL